MKLIDLFFEPFLVNDHTLVLVEKGNPYSHEYRRYVGNWYEDRILDCGNMEVIKYEKNEIANALRVRVKI